MGKYKFPLSQFAYVEPQAFCILSPGIYLPAITIDIHQQHVYIVEILRGKIIYDSDDALAFISLPYGITWSPVLAVGLIMMQSIGKIFDRAACLGLGTVKFIIRQIIFGTSDALFEKVGAISPKPVIVFIVVLESSFPSEILAMFVCDADFNTSAISVQAGKSATGGGIFGYGDVGALPESDCISPCTGIGRIEVNTPFVARVRGAFTRFPVGGEKSGNHDCILGVLEIYIHPIVGKWIDKVGFGYGRAFEC